MVPDKEPVVSPGGLFSLRDRLNGLQSGQQNAR